MKKITALVLTLLTLNNTHAQGIALDKKFGKNGMVSTDTDPFCSEKVASLACQSDGKILAAGLSSITGQDIISAGIIRYQKNGNVDSSFGINGRALLIPPANVKAPASAIAIQKIGNTEYILITGVRANTGNINNAPEGYVARFNPNGTPDASFGTNGIVLLYNVYISSMVVDDSGKILLGSNPNYVDSLPVMGVLRLLQNGQPDNTFGSNGYARVKHSDLSMTNTLALQKDGKIILGGISYKLPAYDNFDILVSRLKTDGTTDSTFGTYGLTKIDPDTNDAQSNSIALQSDGKIIICSQSDTGTGYHFYMVRLLTDGTVDNNFGKNGTVRLDFGNTQAWPYAALVHKNDYIYLAGGVSVSPTAGSVDYRFAIARFKPDGSVDSSFGVNGRDTSNLGKQCSAMAAVITPDNSIVTGGWSYWSQPFGRFDDFALMKYLTGLELSVANTDNTITFSAYPNPSNGNFILELGNTVFKKGQVHVYDITGVEVYQSSVTKQETQINLNVSKGIYLVKLQLDGTTVTKRVTIE